jgi:hypothetical protein
MTKEGEEEEKEEEREERTRRSQSWRIFKATFDYDFFFDERRL